MANIADLLFSTVDGVFAVDGKHKLIFWNSGCAQLFGIPSSEALGRPCSQIVRGKHSDGQPFCGVGCCVSRLSRGTNASGKFPLRVQNRNGDELRFSVSIMLVPSRATDSWTSVHLLRRGAAIDPLDVLAYSSVQPATTGKKLTSNNAVNLSLLTTREQEILQLLTEGLNVAVISQLLNIAVVTVRNHLQHVQEKLGVHSQVETVAYAFRHNLIHY